MLKIIGFNRFKSGQDNSFGVLRYFWHWRRIISLVVLITFSGSLFTPVFASYKNIDSEFGREKKAYSKDVSKLVDGKTNVSDFRVRGLNTFPRKLENKNPLAESNSSKGGLFISKDKYLPYFELGGVKYFNQNRDVAGIYDLFIPLLQTDDKLFFADLRIFDRSGSSFEGNAHLGFRKLYPDKKKMFGVYASFDRKRTDHKKYFSQITVGAEYWSDRWFIGGNFYKPIGKSQELIGEVSTLKPLDRAVAVTRYHEKPLAGFDAELGYSFADNLAGYVGGYYFHEKDTNTVVGPKLSLAYNYSQPQGRILGVLDGIGVEIGAQYDKPRGTTAYVGVKLKVGLTSLDKNSNLFGFERHMVELVRRDPDIVMGNTKDTEYEYYQAGANGFQGGGRTGNQKDNGAGESGDYSRWDLEGLLEEFDLTEDSLRTLSKKDALRVINKKYRKYILKYHPDRNMGVKGTSLYKRYNDITARYNGIYEGLKTRITNYSRKTSFPRGRSSKFKGSASYSYDKQKEYSAVDLYRHTDGGKSKVLVESKMQLLIVKKMPVSSRVMQHKLPYFKLPLTRVNFTRFKIDPQLELQLSDNKLLLERKDVSGVWSYDFSKKISFVNNSRSNDSAICLVEEQSSYDLWSQVVWLKSGLKKCVSWIWLYSKISLGGMFVGFSAGVVKYFLGYLFGEDSNRDDDRGRQSRWGSYFGGNDDGDDKFPPRPKFPARFFLISKNNVPFVPVVQNDVNDELHKSVLESLRVTPYTRHVRQVLNNGRSSGSLVKQLNLKPSLDLQGWNYPGKGTVKKRKLVRKSTGKRRTKKNGGSAESVTGAGYIVNLNYEYEDQDMNALLRERSREVGLSDVTTVIMPPVSDVGGQLRREFLEERRRHVRESQLFARTLLVPVHLHGLDHWVGLVICLGRNSQVESIQYVDSLGYEIPRHVELVLREVYGSDVVIRNVRGLQQTDEVSCGPLTIENLIRTAQGQLYPDIVTAREIREIRQHHIELLERRTPNLQFNFRQRHNVRTFEGRTAEGLILNGGLLGYSLYKNMDLLSRFFSMVKMAKCGGMCSSINFANNGESRPLLEGNGNRNGASRWYNIIKEKIDRIANTAVGEILFTGIPILGTRISESAVIFIGGKIFSRAGATAVAAGADIVPIQNFLLAASRGILYIIGPVVKRINASGKELSEVGGYYRKGMILGTIAVLPVTAIMFFVGPFLKLCGRDEVVANEVQSYFYSLALAVPAITWLKVTQQLAFGTGKEIIAAFTSIVDLALTLFFGWGFVLGKFSLPKLGMIGYGWARVIGSWVDLIILKVVLLTCGFGDYCTKYQLLNFKAKTRDYHAGIILRDGAFIGLSIISELATFIFYPMIANRFGKRALQVLSVGSEYSSALIMPLLTVTQLTAILIAKGVGEKDPRKVRWMGNLGVVIGATIPLVFLLTYLVAPRPIVAFFIEDMHDPDDPKHLKLMTMLKSYLAIIISGNVLDAVRNVAAGALRPFEDTVFPAVVGGIALWTGVAIAYPVSSLVGIDGLAVSMAIGMSAGAVVVVCRWFYKSNDDDLILSLSRREESGQFLPVWKKICLFFSRLCCFSCCRRFFYNEDDDESSDEV